MTYYHHVSLLTRHREENVAFYTELLGLRFVKNTVNQDNHRMLHYYYGDFQGAPGSVITFFVVPKLGNRYENDHYLAEIEWNLPAGSFSYWKDRLKKKHISYTEKENQLFFTDPDDVILIFTETDQPPLSKNHQIAAEVPGDKQLLGLRSIHFHVPDPAKTSDFFRILLDWQTENGVIQLSSQEFIKISASDTTNITRMGRGSIDHVAFAVKDEKALKLLYKKAKEQQWTVEKIVSRGYFKSLYIREPGGIRVEFATMGPGFTIDEELAHLGESFALPPFLENQRAEIENQLYPEN
ncbi:VOC family protein [Enterococcus sp. AZ072]|uniref:VOC family protein n=1 Tax=unclassified Enterococcus TaxID=2608891 RepID=UPI003D2680B2